MSPYILKSAGVTKPVPFDLRPDAEARAALADQLEILGVRKLVFEGNIAPDGPSDLRLEAMLGATVVQACVVSGQPVTTRIDEAVTRRYVADMELPEGDEIEMPEDDTADPLPEEIDLADVMAEALALALPPWPRSDEIDPVDLTVTEPGKSPMTDDDAKPFAGLRDQLERKRD